MNVFVYHFLKLSVAMLAEYFSRIGIEWNGMLTDENTNRRLQGHRLSRQWYRGHALFSILKTLHYVLEISIKIFPCEFGS